MASSLVYDIVTIAAVVNPIEAAAAFATLVGSRDLQQQNQIALRATAVAGILLILFAFVGSPLLLALGIGLPAFRIAGGLLLFCVGFKMVFSKESATEKLSPAEQSHAEVKDDPSVFPLAIPIITGPGALTTVVALMSKKHHSLLNAGQIVGASILVMVVTFLAMRASRWLTRALGPTGINVIGRIMGILVSAIAIQMIIDGVSETFPGLMR